MALARPASFRMSSWCEIGNFRPRSGTARGLARSKTRTRDAGRPRPELSLLDLVLDLRDADPALHG